MSGSEGGTTILETPPYVIALVFFFFLVITLGFEKLLQWLRQALQKRGKQGLLSAMTNMQNELMCLGFATLVLLLFQSNITSYCLNAKSYTKTWLDHVQGCSCCLTRTRGLSPCYLAAKSCVSNSTLAECCSANVNETNERTKVCTNVFNTSTDWDTPNAQGIYTLNSVTGEISAGAAHRRQLLALGDPVRALLGAASGSSAAVHSAEEVQCDGRVQTGWEECAFRPGYRPAIGATALHQVHLFIFITAIVHIALGVLLIVAASQRLRIWRSWRDADDSNIRMTQQAVDEHAQATDAVSAAGKLESQGGDSGASHGTGPDTQGEACPHPTQLSGRLAINRKSPWPGRPEELQGLWARFREACTCLGRQFLPNVVTREEFSLMRCAFMLTHHIRSSARFSFLDYLTLAMEDDFAHVVGLGLPMWCFIIVFVLLSSAIGWCIWVFVLISGVLLAVVNTKLVWIARYVTRGGHVHKLRPGIFWLNRPWMLLPVIKFLLFFVSYCYSNAIFFATQFGSSSCFFSSAGFQGQPVPWWLIMVVNTIYLASLSMLTLPLYSITVQMGGDFKAHLLPSNVVHDALRFRSIQAINSRGLRQLLSTVLPRQREAGRTTSLDDMDDYHGSASLVHHAQPFPGDSK